MNPAEGAEFIAQTAQFTQVEKMQEVADSTAASLTLQQRWGAGATVGREVDYVGADGLTTSGTVTAAVFTADEPVLRVTTADRHHPGALRRGAGAARPGRRRSPGRPARPHRPDHGLRPSPTRSPPAPPLTPAPPTTSGGHRAPFHVLLDQRSPLAPDDDGRHRQQHRQRQHRRLQVQPDPVPGHPEPAAAGRRVPHRPTRAAPTPRRSASAPGSPASPPTSARARRRPPAAAPTS